MKNLFTLAFVMLFVLSLTGQSTWTNQTSGISTNIHAIYFANLTHGWAVGEGGKIISTTNIGKTWTAQTSGITTDLNGVYFVNDSTGWAVGNGGKILYTENFGATWTAQTSGTTQTLWDVSFANATTGWAMGQSDVILHTTNAGLTWTDQTVSVLPNIMSISVLDQNNVFASGYSGSSIGRVIKTSDGGTNWTALNPGTATLNGVCFINTLTGWAVGNGGTIIHTTDGGTNWETQTSNVSEVLLDVHFINDTTGWVVGMAGKVLYTKDAGTTWETVNTGLTVNLRKLFFINENRGWLCGNSGKIQYTRTSEEICLVTVDTLTAKNFIIWERIPGQGTSFYKIYKFVVGSTYQVIDTVPYDNMSTYIDASSSPETNSDRYKISAVDSMGNESDKSPYHETMLLQVSQGVPSTTIVLSWNQYVDESGNFLPSAYAIFRGTSPSTVASYINLTGVNTGYNDINVSSTQYYMISVVRPTPCYPSSTTKEVGGPYSSSYSNMEDNLVSIFELTLNNRIICQPNPMVDQAIVFLPDYIVGNQTASVLTITDISGKIVRKINVTTNEIVIERGDLKKGIYFIDLKADKVYRGKLVVE